MSHLQAKPMIAVIFVILALGIVSAIEAQTPTPERKAVRRDELLNLRELFYSENGTDASTMVASVSIMLIESSGSREVRIDHPFRSGDRFRFIVSSNIDGWLYVFNLSPTGNTQQLWPQQTPKADFAPDQEVKAGQSYLIPPSPGKFVFDEKIGQEEFIIAIRSQKKSPDLRSPEAAMLTKPSGTDPEVLDSKREMAAIGTQPRKKTMGNIIIRGDPFTRGGTTRGTFFDPGTDDHDPRIYFSAAQGDETTKAMVKFKLRHVK